MTINLAEISTRAPKGLDKAETKKKTEVILQELDELQNLLYAEQRRAVLIIIQGMDASGKDGLSRHVFSRMNPQGVQVESFKAPTEQELAHDFLWRVHRAVPAKGRIQIFNRSHYEDVLVTRVKGLSDDETCMKRMRAINDFERLLVEDNATEVIKLYLHVSQERQLERLKERMENPAKMWKYSPDDIKDIKLHETYSHYYEEVFRHCSEQPWEIIPADQNWYKEYLVAKILRGRLESLNMAYPVLKLDA
jgi:PPK2 family polyphosphate:nucleotide phosphotransferase